jgi:hypothetical protein
MKLQVKNLKVLPFLVTIGFGLSLWFLFDSNSVVLFILIFGAYALSILMGYLLNKDLIVGIALLMIYISVISGFALYINFYIKINIILVFVILSLISFLSVLFKKKNFQTNFKINVNLPSLAGSFIWLIIGLYTKVTKGENWLAWSMSGDARNAIKWTIDIYSKKSISPNDMADYALFPYGFQTIILSVNNLLGNFNLIQESIELNALFLFVIFFLQCYLYGYLGQQVIKNNSLNQKVLSFFLSLIPLSALFLGINLTNGFINSIWAQLCCILMLNLFYLSGKSSYAIDILYLTLYVFVFMTWIFLAPIIFIFHFYAKMKKLKGKDYSSNWWNLLTYVLITILLSTPILLKRNSIPDIAANAGGTFPSPESFFFLGFAFFILISALKTKIQRNDYIFAFTVSIYIISVVVLISYYWIFDTSFWSYFSVKFLWLHTFWILPIVIIYYFKIIILFRRIFQRAVHKWLLLPLSYVMIGTLIFIISPINHQIRSIAQGWYNPNVRTINFIWQKLEAGDPEIVWQGFERYSEDRLANFWLSLRESDENQFEILRGFAYDSDHQTVSQLCNLIGEMEEITINTSNFSLMEILQSQCYDVDTTKVRVNVIAVEKIR